MNKYILDTLIHHEDSTIQHTLNKNLSLNRTCKNYFYINNFPFSFSYLFPLFAFYPYHSSSISLFFNLQSLLNFTLNHAFLICMRYARTFLAKTVLNCLISLFFKTFFPHLSLNECSYLYRRYITLIFPGTKE